MRFRSLVSMMLAPAPISAHRVSQMFPAKSTKNRTLEVIFAFFLHSVARLMPLFLAHFMA